MTGPDIHATAAAAAAFIRVALPTLAHDRGDDDETVIAGRRALVALEAIPADAVLVTPDTLTAAILRGWPARRNTPSNAALTARTILAALRTTPR